MTREEISAITGIAAKTLANQATRFLGPPTVARVGRGKKSTWNYLQIKPRIEAEIGHGLPSLEEARQIIAAKRSV
jgi:hypothetical protein